MDIKVKINSFAVPDKVNLQGKLRSRQDGFHESLSLNLSELDEDTLSKLCDQFRKNVFEKANKKDPRESNHIGFEYVQIPSNGHDGMEGWINLFFNDEMVALINNDYLASQIKQSILERH